MNDAWKDLRVPRLPADTVARLRAVTPAELQQRLGVLAQWRLDDGRWIAVDARCEPRQRNGVRRAGDVVQVGLRESEIEQVARRLKRLLERIDDGEIGLLEGSQP